MIVTKFATSRAQPLNASSSESSEASLSRSAEGEILHLLIEVKASEVSESCLNIKSYEKEKYQRLIQRKETVRTNALAVVRSSEHQA